MVGASSGNHAQALALAGRLLAVGLVLFAVVVMLWVLPSHDIILLPDPAHPERGSFVRDQVAGLRAIEGLQVELFEFPPGPRSLAPMF